MSDRWFDVVDEQGIWRVGQCLYQDQKGMKNICLDGFHSNFNALFCQHSDKILPVRTKTKGLTVPENKKPLRQVLSAIQIQNIAGRLNLYLLKPNFLQFQPNMIRSIFRTQFLILADKIVSTPFEVIRQIKTLDLQIYKVFINLINLYTRILDFSKVFMTMQNSSNQAALQLYKSVYQLTIMVKLILGIHSHSSILYDHKLNINLKATGLLDYLIKSQGINPFRTFIKSSTNYLKNKQQTNNTPMLDLQISLSVIQLFLDICEMGRNQVLQGQNKARTSLLVDDIISNLRTLADSNEQVFKEISKNMTLLAKIQALYLKIKPNKQCNLRKYLSPKEQTAVKAQPVQKSSIHQQKIDQQTKYKISQLQLKIKKMQKMIIEQKFSQKPVRSFDSKKLPNSLYQPENSPLQKFPTQNLGQELFLASVEWALQCGDTQTAKKLVKWRKSILQVGKIAGWQTALLVGCKTFKKAEINAEDIIEANYEILLKNSEI